MKRILTSIAAAMSLAACGGSSSSGCDAAVNAMVACARGFGKTVTDAEIATGRQSCAEASCTGNKQAMLDCIAALPCGADETSYAAGLDSCASANDCSHF